MTNEEAIRVLNVAKAECEWNAPLEYQEAFDVAIEALKAQPKHDQNTPQKQPDPNTLGIKTDETCEDVISRQDAIGLKLTLSEVQTNLRKTPSAQPEPQWIPCSEALPEEDHWLGGSGKQFSDDVLVSIYNGDDEDEWVDVSQTIDGEWIIELPRHCEIVAWMPLPKPYKRGNCNG